MKYQELRDALAMKPSLNQSIALADATHPDTLRALLAERDALRYALNRITICPSDAAAGIARAALSQGE